MLVEGLKVGRRGFTMEGRERRVEGAGLKVEIRVCRVKNGGGLGSEV